MWITTTTGFYSAVAHRDDASQLLIRARSRGDLVRLNELARTIHLGPYEIIDSVKTHADYPWRTVISKFDWCALLTEMATGIDYDNFKNAVATRHSPQRAHTYHRVWEALHSIHYERTAAVYPPPKGKVKANKRGVR